MTLMLERYGYSDNRARMLMPAQLRAARALLGWSRDELAKRSGIAAITIKGFELGASDPKQTTVHKWKRSCEEGGLKFIEADEHGGPGVRLTASETALRKHK